MITFVQFYAAAVVVASTSLVSAHISLWHNSMWGFNVTDGLRPQDPLMNLPFDQWWFRGYFNHPPHPNDIMQLPVGQNAMTELSCDKDATTWWTSGPGGDQQDPNNPDYPCPGQPTTQFHTNGINDLGGCALAVAYKSDVNEVQPEDFVVFSVNHTCVWNLHTYFEVPADMPPCPNNKCTCAWFWIHREDSGSEQNYMTGFQCNFANAASTKTLAAPKVPRRCGPEQSNNFTWNYSNCTYGAKQPFYWYQAERNNMIEGTYTPPLYLDLYNFHDGAQNDIFENTTDTSPSSQAASASSAANMAAVQTTTTSPSSLPSTPTSTPKNELPTSASSSSSPHPNQSSEPPAAQSPSPHHESTGTPGPDGGASHTGTGTGTQAAGADADAAKSTAPPTGAAAGASATGHAHHHEHSDECTCQHEGSHDSSESHSQSAHPSRNYHHFRDWAQEHTLPRAWGARHRHSLHN